MNQDLPEPDFSFDCDGTPCYYATTVRSLIAAAVEGERDLCAEACDEVKAEAEQWARGADTGMYDHQAQGAENCAAAIRARGDS